MDSSKAKDAFSSFRKEQNTNQDAIEVSATVLPDIQSASNPQLQNVSYADEKTDFYNKVFSGVVGGLFAGISMVYFKDISWGWVFAGIVSGGLGVIAQILLFRLIANFMEFITDSTLPTKIMTMVMISFVVALLGGGIWFILGLLGLISSGFKDGFIGGLILGAILSLGAINHKE